ncbi:MAG: hypothetical protein IJT06_03245 [Selenomonadaceae bacterium]|nr:hypothetical protein [Selenomonadaceae bacterium]
MEKFFKAQLEEIRKNKIRFGLLVAALIVAVICAIADSQGGGEEIELEPKQVAQVEKNSVEEKKSVEENISVPQKNSSVSDNVTVVIGANANEVYVADPFKKTAPSKKETQTATSEIPAQENISSVEKKLPPDEVEEVVTLPAEIPAPKPPEEKFILRGIALGEVKTALIEKVVSGKIETLFLRVGDSVGGKKILDITNDFVILENDEKLELTH